MIKKKWLGSLMNLFVPGLGNAYAGKPKKGVIIYVLSFVVVFSLRFIAYNFTLFLIWVTVVIGYYLFMIISGYRDVQKDRVYKPKTFDKWYVLVAIIVLHTVVVNSITARRLDSLTPISFARIPTPAMDPALMVGDILAYKKTKEIERKDVTLFWFPEDTNTLYVKRCIGMPGDSLQIKEGVVLVNKDPLINIPRLKYSYSVMTSGSQLSSRILEKYKIEEEDYYKVAFDIYNIFLTKVQANKLKKLDFLKSVEPSLAVEGFHDESVYPKSGKHNWNRDFYGPIYIPKQGDTIQLTPANIDLYLTCLEFENESVKLADRGLIIDGQQTTNYQFKESYYFMMGDNRHNSLDSRYWGFLPEDLVVGKAMYLYWGKDFERIGKVVI